MKAKKKNDVTKNNPVEGSFSFSGGKEWKPLKPLADEWKRINKKFLDENRNRLEEFGIIDLDKDDFMALQPQEQAKKEQENGMKVL
jgi:hypothetical protein